MNIEYSTSTTLLLFLGAVLLTAGIVLIMKRYFNNKDANALIEKYKDGKRLTSASARNKYPEVDVFALRNTFMGYGLALSIGLMIVAFGWTTYESTADLSGLVADLGDEIEMETPRTVEPPPPPPPPPAPTALQIVESDVLDLETIEFEDMSINEDTGIEGPVAPIQKEVAPPPPPPPPPQTDAKEIFKIVEEQPTFKGCEQVMDKLERKTCAEQKMMAFIYENIAYPAIARENNISGVAVVQFVVETDGSISNVNVIRDVGGGCGEEAMRVIKMMPAWNPGKQRGRAVRVMFTLPVKFKLA